MPLVKLLLRGLVAVVVVLAVWRQVDGEVVLAAVSAAPAWVLAAPSVLLLANSGVHALRIRLLLPNPRPPVGQVLAAVLIGNFFGLFLPTGGGEAAKAVALGRIADPPTALACLATSRALELLPWGLLVVWGAAGVLPGRLDAWIPAAWLAALGLITACVAFFALRRLPVAWLPPRLAAWLGAALGYRPTLLATTTCALAALPFAAVNCLVVWLLLDSMGAHISYAQVLGLVPTMDVVISLPISVAGVGVREATFVHALSPYGVTPGIAVAVATLRWSGEVFRSLIGGVCYLFLSPNRHR